MQLPYSGDLEVQYLSRLFDNTSECYKFFWFQAIVSKVLEGKEVKRQKRVLTKNVPYRLQAPFMNNIRGKEQAFREFSSVLEEVIQPIYQSAKNCGFKNWIYAGIEDDSTNLL